jgi:hypothetical protein
MAVGVGMRKTSTRHIRQKKDSGEPYTKEDYIRSEYSAFGVSNLMICSCLIAITSYINALFLCKELNLLGTGQERWQLKVLLRNVSPFYWEEQCSELNPYCTVETNSQHRFCVNVLCNDLIGPFIFECR